MNWYELKGAIHTNTHTHKMQLAQRNNTGAKGVNPDENFYYKRRKSKNGYILTLHKINFHKYAHKITISLNTYRYFRGMMKQSKIDLYSMKIRIEM